jgi:uncharacterized protein YodC (DUF2158 family)
MEQKFKGGDKVRLISGGPVMTVINYHNHLKNGSFTEFERSTTNVECEYYSEKENRFVTKVSHQETLEKVI